MNDASFIEGHQPLGSHGISTHFPATEQEVILGEKMLSAEIHKTLQLLKK